MRVSLLYGIIFLSYEDATDADREVMGLENRD